MSVENVVVYFCYLCNKFVSQAAMNYKLVQGGSKKIDEVKEEMIDKSLEDSDNHTMNMACDIKVEAEERAEVDRTLLSTCTPLNLITEITNKDEGIELANNEVNNVLHSGELSCDQIKIEIEDQEGKQIDVERLDKTNIKEETFYLDTEENKFNKISDDTSSVASGSILRGLFVQNKENSSVIMENSEQDKSLEEENVSEESTAVEQFRVNMSAIESVSKENQASELQDLDGLSVYDQATLEAGILRQVDQALEDELDSPGQLESAILLEAEDEETEMERQIRLGEMTPFGTTLRTPTTGLKQTSGLSEIEKYLQKQAEFEKSKKQKVAKSAKNEARKDYDENRPKESDKKKVPLKKKVLNKDRKRKRKRKKEVVGTETENFVPWSVRPGHVAGERAYMYPEDASGSEYKPSEDSDDQPSSDDEVAARRNEMQKKKQPVGKNRNLRSAKPYKIPEDWASDDSDWEYSDEEGNLKTNKRSKKELDDGDVDAFNRRFRLWEREQERLGVNVETPKYHQLDGDYKIPKEMWDKLYNYQRVGVRWLWELDRQRCGGILGDEMGLGKTIQVICFLAGLQVSEMRDHDTNYRGLGPTLIVCPTTVMHQWVREFHVWYPPLRVAILHESGTFSGKQRSRLIGNMVHARGVLITSYTGATQHKEEMLARNWHYVILDEGHKIRNPDAQITLAVKQLRTSHRIILSGSPMQNNLKELWSLFDFVFPGKLGTLPVFLEQFAVPITQGGYANASQVQVMTAFKCATVLKDSIAPYLLRRMKADVKSHICLPEKNEQVLFCRLTDEQRQLYRGYVESGEVCRILEGRLKIFMGLINLRKICNHPDLYSGGTKILPGDKEEDLAEEEKYGHWGKSGKMIVVQTLLQIWKKQGHRVLIFTQSRQMLTILEAFVRQAGYMYLKLDGNTSIAARQPLINKFNQDTLYFVMLLTTKVGGLGVNLTGANRVLIYDPDWNPATDTQARERAWRIGQTQSVTVYRLITAGTIEEKMYHRQIFKQFLCNKVLKDPRQRRFFKSNDLFELFTLKETDKEGSTETAAIFAGTGSEVLLDPTKTYKHRKVEPRLTAERPTETYSRKKEEKKRKIEEKLKKRSSVNENSVSFSNDKIERMKKLAQMLSQKIVNTKSPEKSKQKPNLLEESNLTNTDDVVLISDEDTSHATGTTVDVSRPSTSKTNDCASVRHRDQKKKKKHKNKRKKCKDAKFEGETVPFLVKTREGEPKKEGENEEEEKNYATQDEYVLQKLFSGSGLQTAMKHDTIMEGGPADYALVEGEAERVAKQAVEKLKESRQECWRATSGVPSFTGINGARNFQSKKKTGSGKCSVDGLSSKELLAQIRKRNLNTKAKDADMELVDDIRHFVSSFGGTVNTNQVIARFEGRLAEGSSPLFKSLLSKICTFYRAPDKLGYWTLKDEFNW